MSERPQVGKRALITGVTGQDGSYLAELLLDKGYDVYGMVRRSSSFNTSRLAPLLRGSAQARLHLVLGDLSDASSIHQVIRRVQPDEVYNLGAQSHVKVSFEIPEYTADVTGVGCLRLLEAVHDRCPEARFYQASTSELFGLATETPQSERTPFYPRSPYACAKAFAYYATRNYRESYGMFAVNGILFNHESPRRGEAFVTRKITRAVARIRHGLQSTLCLGNLDARRDWGYAGDFVMAMWLMLQTAKPEDFVIATGTSHSVREFCEIAFAHAGMPIRWQGEGIDEVGIGPESEPLVRVDPGHFRPAEVHHMLGDATKAHTVLGWSPSVSLVELVRMMLDADLAEVSSSAGLTGE